MADNVLVTEIFHKKYHIKLGDNDPEYIKTLSAFVNERMEKYNTMFPEISLSKLAILTCLNITDELFKTKEQSGSQTFEKLKEIHKILSEDNEKSSEVQNHTSEKDINHFGSDKNDNNEENS